MELLQLKYFLAVAESEHMTNTAKQLHIAQPALTQSIHRLEQELGVSLFERAGRGIRLSPAGAYVRDRVKPAMETLENVARDVQLFQQGEQGVVRVGVHAASGVAIDGIAAYSELNPHVSFEITQDERERHRDVIVTTITPRGSSTVENAMEKTPFSERIGIAVPASSALGDTASLADFANERFIALAGSRRFREVCDTFCARRALHPAYRLRKRQSARREEDDWPRAWCGVLARPQLGRPRPEVLPPCPSAGTRVHARRHRGEDKPLHPGFRSTALLRIPARLRGETLGRIASNVRRNLDATARRLGKDSC